MKNAKNIVSRNIDKKIDQPIVYLCDKHYNTFTLLS